MDRELLDVMSFSASDEDDYYNILGCDELSTKEQISTEYKLRALQCHPDKFPDDLEKAKEFERIQTAKDVLCDDEQRHNYDKWRRAGLAIPFQKWCNMRDAVHTSMHWAAPKKEHMIEVNQTQGTSNSPCDVRGGHSSHMDSKTADSRGMYSVPAAPTPWVRDYEPSESLRKFRNYEI